MKPLAAMNLVPFAIRTSTTGRMQRLGTAMCAFTRASPSARKKGTAADTKAGVVSVSGPQKSAACTVGIPPFVPIADPLASTSPCSA